EVAGERQGAADGAQRVVVPAVLERHTDRADVDQPGLVRVLRIGDGPRDLLDVDGQRDGLAAAFDLEVRRAGQVLDGGDDVAVGLGLLAVDRDDHVAVLDTGVPGGGGGPRLT